MGKTKICRYHNFLHLHHPCNRNRNRRPEWGRYTDRCRMWTQRLSKTWWNHLQRRQRRYTVEINIRFEARTNTKLSHKREWNTEKYSVLQPLSNEIRVSTKEYTDNAPVWPVEKDRRPPASGRLVSPIKSLCTRVWYRHSAPLPSCKVESLETRIVNTHVFIYRLWCLHGNIAYFYQVSKKFFFFFIISKRQTTP